MTSRLLLNLALAALAIGLGLLVYFKPGLEPGPAPQPLTTLVGKNQATRIQIERVEREPLSFIRQDGHWVLLNKAQKLPASIFQVQALLRLLETTSSNHYPADTVDLESLGLEPPQASITINDVEIRFGITESLENRRYLLVDSTVFLVRDQYQHLVNADWSNFVDRKLLPADASITLLRLPGLQLSPGNNSPWQLTPDRPDIGADAIQQLLDNWSTANALYVRRYDGTHSDETIHIETGDDGTALDFMITAHTPELVLARPELGIQYHLSSGLEQALLTLQQTSAE